MALTPSRSRSYTIVGGRATSSVNDVESPRARAHSLTWPDLPNAATPLGEYRTESDGAEFQVTSALGIVSGPSRSATRTDSPRSTRPDTAIFSTGRPMPVGATPLAPQAKTSAAISGVSMFRNQPGMLKAILNMEAGPQ